MIIQDVQSTLGELPGFHAHNKDDGHAKHETPLPGNGHMLENDRVQVWDVDGGENAKGAENNGPEEEAVLVDVLEQREAALVVGVQAEHATPDVLELPRTEEDHPGQLGKDSCPSTEHRNARI